ncbi:NlpC/P60 family protein [Kitasatospora sp. NPDC089913]|uniref:C40 family peptidase n=1 Tax=Streptomycetaceae TaxID=2062 RepID=UPI00087AEE9E|nr:C40 family peptidase [Streptomyces sp. TLI_053]SDS91946.1 Cell wall-associated hydrolase, NlpC family [Streptomyces sp. TLI_053]
MGKRRKPSPPSRARLAVLTTAVVGGTVLASGAARAEPAPTLASVKEQVDRLNEEAEQAIERYNGFQEKQQKLQGEANRIQEKLARGQDAMNELRTQLGVVGAEQYRTNGIDPGIQLMLDSDPAGYLGRASVQGQVADSWTNLLRRAQDEQRKLDQERAEAAATLADLDAVGASLNAQKTQIQSKLAQSEALLNRLSAEDRARINAQEAADRARAAAQQAAAAERAKAAEKEAADRAKAAAKEASGKGATAAPQTPAPNTPAPAPQTPAANTPAPAANTPAPPAAGGRAAAIVQFAYAQLGKPYGWSKTGPSSFDCSGLTGAAYRAADVSLPRTSQEQWKVGARIARGDLQPGDLVFFYNDLHHVGVYIGDGKMIHAPRTGKNIEVLPIGVMPYMGAVRP